MSTFKIFLSILIAITVQLISLPANAQQAFVTTWETTGTNETITIGTYGDISISDFDFTIDWGDGVTESISGNDPDPSHQYSNSGTYTVEITGTFPALYLNDSPSAKKLLTIEQWGDISWEQLNSAFEGASNITYNATDTIDLSIATNLDKMFKGATNFNGDLSGWDVSNIFDMTGIFADATNFNGDISTWDLSGLSKADSMFTNATNFNVDISGWNVSNVTSMASMFHGATSFDQNINTWNVSNVTNMKEMFRNASSFNQDLNNWDISSVTNLLVTFQGATSFNGNISTWDVSSVTDMSGMFLNASSFNQDLTNWNVSNVTNMNSLFYGATIFNGDISTWDVSSVTNMYSMFRRAESFNQDIGSWNVSSVTNMMSMFQYAYAFNQDLNSWDVSSVITMNDMFEGASIFNGNVSTWDVSNVTSMANMFYASDFNGDISNWNVSNVTNMERMFTGSNFAGDISSWDVSSVTSMERMFNVTPFNQDISGWDVSSVTNMESMFLNTDSFNQDISNWDVSNVTDMEGMFMNADAFNQDISGWDVSSVTNMESMFYGNDAFDQDISDWDITSVTTFYQFLYSSSISTTHYDSLLSKWSSLNVQTNVTFVGGSSNYTSAGNSGRQHLIDTYNWEFSDGVYIMDSQFITIWETTSSDESIAIPVYDGYGAPNFHFIIDWGDGTSELIFGQDPEITHTYEVPGTYTVSITGTFPQFTFLPTSTSDFNALKLKSLENWGEIKWNRLGAAFSGAENMVYNATDAPDLSNITSLSSLFKNNKALNADLSNWDVSNIISMTHMFNGATSFNGDITNWDVSNVVHMHSMFLNSASFDQNLGGWNVSNVGNFGSFLDGTNLSSNNYDSLLVGWSNLNLQNNLTFDAGSNLYTTAASSFRDAIINDNGWTINDGGLFQPFTTTWQTTFANETISIPTNGLNVSNYNFTIDWGDGNSESITGDDPNPSHMYSSAGTYTVQITGIFPWLYLNGSSDASKLSSIEQWGDIPWENMNSAFEGASNMSHNATDMPNLVSVTQANDMFRNASSFNGDISNWNVSSITDMNRMFEGAASFDQNLADWDVSNVSDFTGFLTGGELSESNYSYLLIGWNELDLQGGLTFDAGNSTYNKTGQTAKESIQDNENWTFSDGGLINYGPEITNSIDDVSLDEDFTEYTLVNLKTVFSDVNAPQDTLIFSISNSNSSIINTALESDSLLILSAVSDSTGNATVDVTATDTFGESITDSFTITINPVNDPVSLQQTISDTSAYEDNSFTYTFSGDTFYDIDGDELSYSAIEKDSTSLPDWLSFNSNTRTFSGTPLASDVGIDSIQVTANDGNGTSVTDHFAIEIIEVNDPVILQNSIPDVSGNEDEVFSFTFPEDTFYDEDGDELTYTAIEKDSSTLPDWLSFETSTRTFSGTPLMKDIGTYTITVTATDGNGTSDSDDFNIIISNTNDAVMVANPIPDTTANEDQEFTFTFSDSVFYDQDGDELAYTAIEKDSSSLPSWLSFDATTRTFSGTPLVTDTGTNTIEVTAADGNGSSTVDEFVIMVENSNDAPTILNALSDQVLDEDFTPFELARLDTVFTDEESSLDNSLTYSYSITGSSITASLTDSLMTLNSVPDSSGTNELIIQATDSEGITVSDTLEISVNSVNDKPVPNFALVTRALTSDGMEVQFADSSSDSKDPNGSITEWNWDFGNDLVSSEQSPSVLFTEEGTYDVKLVVTDNDSGIDSLTKQIDIELVLTDSISISGGSDVVADFEDLGVYLYFNSISDGNYTITTQQKINGEEEIPEGISFYIGNYFWSIDLNTESNQEPEFQYSLSFDLSETDGIDTMNVSSMTILKRNNESESWTSVEDIGGVVNFNTDLQILSVGNLTTFSDFILASKDLGTSNELLQGIPDDFELSQNYPNPFNPNTNIRFGLPEASEVRLEIFNILGQKVAVLVNGKMNAGYHLVNFDASRYSSGMYIYRIIAKDFVKTKKMLLLK